jgi:hypothetical protein
MVNDKIREIIGMKDGTYGRRDKPEISFMEVKLQVLTVSTLKFTVFWDVLPCSQIDVDRRFRVAYCLQHQSDETSVNIYLTTRQ